MNRVSDEQLKLTICELDVYGRDFELSEIDLCTALAAMLELQQRRTEECGMCKEWKDGCMLLFFAGEPAPMGEKDHCSRWRAKKSGVSSGLVDEAWWIRNSRNSLDMVLKECELTPEREALVTMIKINMKAAAMWLEELAESLE